MDPLEQTTLTSLVKVRPEMNTQFMAWQEKMNSTIAKFPGFVSLEMLPQSTKNESMWMNIQRFRTYKDLEAWRLSEERRLLLTEVKPYLFGDISEVIQDKKLQACPQDSVTEVFVTSLKPGKHEAYRKWASKIQQIESQFPGYQGVYMQAPSDEEKNGDWITILRFDTPEHLDAWLNSNKRQEILKESESLVEVLQSHRISAFAGWFGDISKQAGETMAVWKQTMLILLVLFPIVMLEMKFLNPLLKGWNLSLATFIGNAISVSLVSWPMIPLTIKCLGWWLVPGKDRLIQKTILGILIVVGLYFVEIVCLWNLL